MTDRAVRYRIQADLGDFQAKMKQASASTKQFGNDLMALDKNGAQMRAGLDQLGGTAGKIGLVAAAGLGAAAMKAADFDQAMSNIQAATHETAGNMDLLREAALKAGADTAFSATEAAGAVENLAKAGVSTADILGGGLSGALDLAAAGELQVADAAEIAATALTQFNLAGEDVPHVADLLAAGAGKAQGEVSDLSAALNQSGLVAAQTGLSIEETVGTLSAFASAGLLGSDAGTSFKTMLQSLTPTSKAARDEMERLGISAYDANGEFIGMAEFAGVLQNALAGMSVEQQNATMKTIFGANAVRAASVIFSQGADGVQEWTDKVSDSGYAAETAAIKMDNLKGDWEEFTGALETALIGTGDGAQGPLRSLVQGLTAVTNAYNDLPKAAQSATAGILGVVAVAGGGLFAFSKIVTSIADTRQALSDLGPAGTRAADGLSKAGRAARLAGGFLAAGMAAGMLADEIDRIDSSKLERSLDALGRGETTETIKKVIDDLAYTTSKWEAIDLGEVFTLGGIVGDTTLDKKADNIRQLDEALASLVDTGESAKAAELFAEIESQARDAGVSTDDVKESFEQYALAVRNAKDTNDEAAGSTDSLGSAMDGMGDAAGGAADEVQLLVDAMKAQRAEALRAADAEINYHASLDDARAALKANGRTLDVTTEKGRANRSALIDLAGAWNGLSDEQKNAQGASRNARAEFVRIAQQMGMTKKEAQAYARELMEIPPKRTTRIELDGVASAKDALEYLARFKIPDKYVNVYVNDGRVRGYRAPGGVTTQDADGSIKDYYAEGGFSENHVAQIAPAGAWRVWAEPETGGEAYIPLAPSKRERSVDIWQETGRRLGVLFADGGFTGRSSSGPMSVNASLALSDRDISRIADAVAGATYAGAFDGVAQRETTSYQRSRAGSRIGR